MRVVIVGGSLGGLAAAVRLRLAGCDVDVFERSRRPLEGRGAGIVLHPAMTRVLGADVSRWSAHASRLRYLDEDGAIADESPCSYRFSSYFALYRELLRLFGRERYHLATEVVGLRDAGEAVEVETVDGRTRPCELLVGADGVHSSTRARIAPEATQRYAGYVGWRGTTYESTLGSHAFATFAEAVTYHLLQRSHILVYPIPGPDGSLVPGRRLVNWVWYRNVPDGPPLEALLTDRDGVRRELSVGAGAVRDEAIAELRDAARSSLPAVLAEVVCSSPQPFVQVVLDVAVPRMADGRVALIGDAAFVLRPHIAAGTAKAADDARTLAEAVARRFGDVPAALREWEPGRLELGRAALARSRDAGVRVQVESSWRVGDPLPFGLREAGDSYLD